MFYAQGVCLQDYTGQRVSAKNFLAVLAGNQVRYPPRASSAAPLPHCSLLRHAAACWTRPVCACHRPLAPPGLHEGAGPAREHAPTPRAPLLPPPLLQSATDNSSGRVLQNKPEDRIFVYYSDHGAPGVVGMPSGAFLYADQLNSVIRERWVGAPRSFGAVALVEKKQIAHVGVVLGAAPAPPQRPPARM